MTPTATLTEHRPLLGHHPVGASTGYLHADRGDWERLVDQACEVSPFAAELAALSESELPGLVEHLAGEDWLPFHYVSVHAPSKGRVMPEPELVSLLAGLPCEVDAIVVHPDVIEEPARYRSLGRRLVLENMDARKPAGRTADELAPLFALLPEAGLCLDVAHALDVDPSLREGHMLLDRFAARLRHVHVSSLDGTGHHVPLRAGDEAAFTPLLRRCRDVPWILEAPLSR
jgi:xylose isomerase-like TIM barrel protein